jgi:adenylate cyclase
MAQATPDPRPLDDDDAAGPLACSRPVLGGWTPAPGDQVKDVLDALAQRILGPMRYTAEELAGAVGITVDDIEPIWMELGFVPVDRAQPLFTATDLDTLHLLLESRRSALVDDELAFAMARVLGQALARVAATAARSLVPTVLTAAHDAAQPTSEVTDPPKVAATSLDVVADELVPTIERFVAWTWRRHLLAALARQLQPEGTEVVGFADLVGFTRLSNQIDLDDLPDVVGRFQELATQHVVARGGRIVKTIGDAVLFVFADAASAADAAVGLVQACAADTDLPPVRVGLASGPVVEVDGDVYGDTVNRAARLVELARSGTVLADDDTALGCLERGDLVCRRLRPRRLKGLGLVPVWAIRPVLAPPPP